MDAAGVLIEECEMYQNLNIQNTADTGAAFIGVLGPQRATFSAGYSAGSLLYEYQGTNIMDGHEWAVGRATEVACSVSGRC